MKHTLTLIVLMSLLLTACGNFDAVTSAPNPFAITPSPAPSILTATPIFIIPTTSAPPPTLTPSLTPEIIASFTFTPEVSPTFTVTATETETPTSTATLGLPPPPLHLTILGCDTGLDLTHGMGEVTNAYVTLANPSGPNLTNACLTLSAADEGRVHPDKRVCVPSLPSGFQVTLKLTVDTTSNAATLIQIAFTSDQFSRPADPLAACPAIGANKPSDTILNVVVPIP